MQLFPVLSGVVSDHLQITLWQLIGQYVSTASGAHWLGVDVCKINKLYVGYQTQGQWLNHVTIHLCKGKPSATSLVFMLL